MAKPYMKPRVKLWPYVVIPLIFSVIILALLFSLYFGPDNPAIGGLTVFFVSMISIIAPIIISYVAYNKKLTYSPTEKEIKGVSVLTNNQAEQELLNRVEKKYRSGFTAVHEFEKSYSNKVGNQNTDVFVICLKKDMEPSSVYAICAINKENPSSDAYARLSNITIEKRDKLMVELAEKLASEPTKKQTFITETTDLATGRSIIQEIQRPISMPKFAQDKLQQREDVI